MTNGGHDSALALRRITASGCLLPKRKRKSSDLVRERESGHRLQATCPCPGPPSAPALEVRHFEDVDGPGVVQMESSKRPPVSAELELWNFAQMTRSWVR